jgi:aminoglycoside phosphotransferase (APT) family kinase protein
MELVRRKTGLPVPEVVWFEESDEWLRSPFLVTRAVEGEVARDSPPYLIDPKGWFLRGSAPDWRRFEMSTIEILVRIHSIDERKEIAYLQPDTTGRTALEQQVAYQRSYYDWARDGIEVDVLERALELLEKSLPPNDRCVLNWGDGRPGNIIYREFEPVAVLDWEMATIGPPEVDLAWLTFFQQFFAGMADQYGLPPVPAMFDPGETAATYERLSGRTLEDLRWYEAFAGLRSGTILARMSLRNIAFGLQNWPADPNDLILFAPLLEKLLAAL